MNILPKSVKNAIEEFAKLPGIGPKTASRLTFYLLSQDAQVAENIGSSLLELTKKLKKCQNCHTISEEDLCPICQDSNRQKATVMVVAEPLDIVSLEKTGYQGRYHVLDGLISPIDGIGPAQLNINSLLDKLGGNSDMLKEVIIATDPSLEGEATAMYMSKEIDRLKKENKITGKIKITRIARGLPVGGDIEYADEVTLSRALEGRREFD